MGRGSNVKQHRERTKLKPARIKQRQKIKGNKGPEDLPENDLESWNELKKFFVELGSEEIPFPFV